MGWSAANETYPGFYAIEHKKLIDQMDEIYASGNVIRTRVSAGHFI